MPFVEIPPDRLEHLPLFGYDRLVDEGDYVWYSGPQGRERIAKMRPVVWVEDIGEAAQLGATAVHWVVPDEVREN